MDLPKPGTDRRGHFVFNAHAWTRPAPGNDGGLARAGCDAVLLRTGGGGTLPPTRTAHLRREHRAASLGGALNQEGAHNGSTAGR